MKRGKRIISTMLAVVLAAVLLPVLPASKVRAEEGKSLPQIRLSVGNGQTTPQYKAGEKIALSVKIENQGQAAAKNVRITPVIDNEKEWPFEIQNMNEDRLLETIDPGYLQRLSGSGKSERMWRQRHIRRYFTSPTVMKQMNIRKKK